MITGTKTQEATIQQIPYRQREGLNFSSIKLFEEKGPMVFYKEFIAGDKKELETGPILIGSMVDDIILTHGGSINEFHQHFDQTYCKFEGVKSSASYNYMSYLDLEPNKSVRTGFRSSDYYAFRPEERVPSRQKAIIKMCMDAYDKVGIVRNVIDLMGDFGSQGINIVHENKSVESFYQQWFKKIDGKERSERFLNNLYRTGNVILYKSYAKITPQVEKYIKSIANDIKVEIPDYKKSIIPWRYNFFNPLTVEQKDGALNLFLGRSNFEITTTSFFDNFKDGSIPSKVLDMLPPDLKGKIKSGTRNIP